MFLTVGQTKTRHEPERFTEQLKKKISRLTVDDNNNYHPACLTFNPKHIKTYFLRDTVNATLPDGLTHSSDAGKSHPADTESHYEHLMTEGPIISLLALVLVSTSSRRETCGSAAAERFTVFTS